MEELALKIKELLMENDMWDDTRIYFDGKAFCSNQGFIDNINPREFLEYCNPDTLSMSFEGPFYGVVNYGEFPEVHRKFRELLDQYGYYYELGNSWNLTLYPKGG